MRLFKQIILGLLLLIFIASSGTAADSALQINLDVNEFRLKNGMLFLVVERPATPQVACRLAFRAGSALEESGKTGIAHMLEHMMFKGTKNFGSLDFEKDQELQKRIEAAYQVVLKEQAAVGCAVLYHGQPLDSEVERQLILMAIDLWVF